VDDERPIDTIDCEEYQWVLQAGGRSCGAFGGIAYRKMFRIGQELSSRSFAILIKQGIDLRKEQGELS
jgi:hypothetical protein